MLRRTASRWRLVSCTCVPHNFVYSTDLAFYFARFSPRTHVGKVGLPEVDDAIALLQPDNITAGQRWSTTTALLAVNATTSSDMAIQNVNDTRDKALALLERGIDICEGLGGAASTNAMVVNMLRPLYVTRFELLNGVEHLPRCGYAQHRHVHKTILNQAGRLLYYNEAWDKTSLTGLDTSCLIVAHFVRALCALRQRPFHAKDQPQQSKKKETQTASVKTGSSLSGKAKVIASSAGRSSSNPTTTTAFALNVGGATAPQDVLTLPIVLARIDELIELAHRLVPSGEKSSSSKSLVDEKDMAILRWTVLKLMLLKSLVLLMHSGDLTQVEQLVQEATTLVRHMPGGDMPSIHAHEGHSKNNNNSSLSHGTHIPLNGDHGASKAVPELGLFLLAQAEVAARRFDWQVESCGVADEAILRRFAAATAFYADPPHPTTHHNNKTGDATTKDDEQKEAAALASREFEVQAYCACRLSYANFLLNAPRPPATSTRDAPVFLPKQVFTLNPWLTAALPASADTLSGSGPYELQAKVPLSVEMSRQRTGEALERVLQLNRQLMPSTRQNVAAAWTLLSMACLYADTRDYLYATGLFESAKKALVHNYGAESVELVLWHKLRYEYLAGIGSEEEAKTASHEVIHLLKTLDQMPCPFS